MMKRIFLLFFLFVAYSVLPAITLAQVTQKPKEQPKTKTPAKTIPMVVAPSANDFVINATVTGF
ncbi:MAG: hypothetical protein ABIN74_07085, partial [Ferruginibacter sp.]